MSDFQLILLSERERPVRAPPDRFSLIPFSPSARMAEEAFKLTPEQVAEWWTPIQAAAYAAKCVGADGAGNAIFRLLQSGMVDAVASSTSTRLAGRSPSANKTLSWISNGRWHHYQSTGSDLWRGAYAQFYESRGDLGKPITYVAFGIKLNPNDIRTNLPPPNPVHEASAAEKLQSVAPSAKPAEESHSKGGRPRADFWDDLWADICGQIYEGTLVPNRQADIEKAMLDWATNHGKELSEAGARPRARKLFNRLQNARIKT